jgi:hypothetical protein
MKLLFVIAAVVIGLITTSTAKGKGYSGTFAGWCAGLLTLAYGFGVFITFIYLFIPPRSSNNSNSHQPPRSYYPPADPGSLYYWFHHRGQL